MAEERSEVPQYVLSDSPSVTIGGREEASHQLALPIGALLLANGAIAVAESTTSELRYFDASGTHLFTVGGPGEGPGEFGSLRMIGRFAGDGIWSWDSRNDRVQLFDRTGTMIYAVSITAWPEVARSLMGDRVRSGIVPRDVHVLNSGDVIVQPLFKPMLTASGIVRDTIPLVRFGPGGASWSELRPLTVTEDWLVHGGVASLLPFGDRVHMAAGPEAIYMTSRHGGVIGRVVPGRLDVDTIDLGIRRRALSGDDARAMYETMASLSEDYAEALPMPDSMPLLSDIRIGFSGRIWIRTYVAPTDTQQRWIALQETGEVVASLTLDAGVEVMDLGPDYAIIQVTDEYDVPEIRMHRLERVR